jgi:hypothetical protein
MELAERDVERRFLFTDLLQAIHAKIQTFLVLRARQHLLVS